ncbi:hypothetical protein KCU93_g5407, partial [Aureobasidium melanogenum]
MAADKDPRIRKTSISSSSNSFILTCQHWLHVALNRLPFRRRFSPTQSLRARSSPQTPERAPTPPPRPPSVISEQVTFSIQVPFAPQDNRSTKSAAIAEPVIGARARTLSLPGAPGEHLINSRRELYNSD